MAAAIIEKSKTATAVKTTYAYYPGCSLHSSAREYDVSTRLVAGALGIELKELEGWICCGASAAHSTDHLLGLALPAHNLKLAAEAQLPIAVPCAMCFSRLKYTVDALKDAGKKAKIERALDARIEKAVAVISILQAFDVNIPEEKIGKPLNGLKVACYYGCLLARPKEITGVDDENNPLMMDRIMTRLGAEPIAWGLKTECCGASLTLTRPDMVVQLSHRILALAKNLGADCLAVACPMCQMNLDTQQKAIEKKYGEKPGIPVIFFTQLIGLALGISPEKLLLNRLITDPMSLLADKGLR
jgi:heterodisulfide reductase subunit B